MSESLGLSRAAVWKCIRRLMSLGYKISSRKKSGYRLVEKTNLMLPWEIMDGLQTETIGRKIYYFDVADSTQSLALRLASRPHENGSVVIARKQTMGRGRNRRKWISPVGGIWMSVLLRPNFEVTLVSLFPMLVSLALSIAIEKTLKINPALKWPNDVTLKGKKVAGILVDASLESNKIEYLIIGVGINFRINPNQISKNIKGHKKQVIGTLVGKKSRIEPVSLLQSFLFELEHMCNSLLSGKQREMKKEWEKRSSTIGKNVDITTPGGKVRGRAIGMDDDGALLVSMNGRIQRLLVGDINIQA